MEIGKLDVLEELNLSHNLIAGKIGKRQTCSVVVLFVFLSLVGFAGPIPSSIGHLVHLKELNMSHNRLKGQYCTCDCIFILFTILINIIICISGSIPESFWTIPDLLTLDISFNNLSGDVLCLYDSLLSFAFFIKRNFFCLLALFCFD